MFGDIMGMMGKLKETQKKVEETKARLNNVLDVSDTHLTLTTILRLKFTCGGTV